MTILPDKLMAYADGELDAKERAEIEAAIAADPALAAEVERHRALRRALADAYGPLAEAPAPDHLVALIRESKPAEDRAGGVLLRFPKIERTHWLAMAASLVVGVLIGGTFMGPSDTSPSTVVADFGGLRADGALASALTTRVSADPSTDGVAVGLSFRDQDGAYCRAFTVTIEALAGFACRDEDAWRIRMTVAEAAPQPGGDFRPASTALPEPLLRAIEGEIAGDPLDAAGEAAARDRGWRN